MSIEEIQLLRSLFFGLFLCLWFITSVVLLFAPKRRVLDRIRNSRIHMAYLNTFWGITRANFDEFKVILMVRVLGGVGLAAGMLILYAQLTGNMIDP